MKPQLRRRPLDRPEPPRLRQHSPGAWLLAALLLAGCGGVPEGEPGPGSDRVEPLLVYSGRNESLIGPLLERFGDLEGIEVRARYGETAELAATLLEEGENSPADVFISQDAAALGALSAAGLLRPLEPAALERVPRRFRSQDGDWVGLSGRARTVVYNTERVAENDLPRSLEEIAEPRFRGRFGVAPANASFQAHMAVYRALNGAEALDRLLRAIAANEPRAYAKNGAIVRAAIAGEIDWGLVNHYYLWRALKEDPDAPAANYFMSADEVSSFVNLAGVGRLSERPAASGLISFLLGDEAQRYFAQETFEYPLAAGVDSVSGLPPLAALRTPDLDFAAVSEVLEETLAAINASGLIR